MESVRVGFTGTQAGMTDVQRRALHVVLKGLQVSEFHHGDCIGADAESESLAREMGTALYSHPGCDAQGLSPKRANCAADEVAPVKPYLERNRDIVDACNVLLACPRGPEEARSGTWSTVRYAVRQGTPVVVVYPDGSVEPK